MYTTLWWGHVISCARGLVATKLQAQEQHLDLTLHMQGVEQDSAPAALLFAALGTERTELISWREFKELVTVLN